MGGHLRSSRQVPHGGWDNRHDLCHTQRGPGRQWQNGANLGSGYLSLAPIYLHSRALRASVAPWPYPCFDEKATQAGNTFRVIFEAVGAGLPLQAQPFSPSWI